MRLLSGNAHPPSQQQRGQTMTEYLIILPALLLLILGVIQYAFIYQAKISLNYATFMGARQGALKNANITSIKDGVAGGMTPFFMRTGTTPFVTDLAKARVVAMIEIFNPNTATVEILRPTPAVFEGFAQGSDSMPNDNLMFRPSDVLEGMTIQDANLLQIRVTYCVKLIVPLVNRVIYAIATGIESVKNMTNENFWDSNAETVTNSCSMMNDQYATVRTQVDSITGNLPDKVSIPLGSFGNVDAPVPGSLAANANSLANSAIDRLPNQFPDIPLLNWNVGGMRIPITAEAIVRMQSPVKF